jgi:hypothetical protein
LCLICATLFHRIKRLGEQKTVARLENLDEVGHEAVGKPWDSGTVEYKIPLKAINSAVYMKKERSSHLTVYCFLKWDDFSLQNSLSKALRPSHFGQKWQRSGTLGQENGERFNANNSTILYDYLNKGSV